MLDKKWIMPNVVESTKFLKKKIFHFLTFILSTRRMVAICESDLIGPVTVQ